MAVEYTSPEGNVGICEGGEWRSDNPGFERTLRALLELSPPQDYLPDVDIPMGQFAQQMFDGGTLRVLSVRKSEPGRIY